MQSGNIKARRIKMNETITLNDETVYAGHCIESNDVLWVYLDDSTLSSAFADFNDPEKTEKIVYNNYGNQTTITGYTHLFCIREESTTRVSAGLKK
jgi:hypothetical protein